ncbi:zinc-binding alcohol dehydrogenase [Microbacterium sp. YY-01]|uniref:zinc-binding alcohol dehydrogenase n=1 Tax=Microbacterium sp. YY-01 TaxID=3421634 RepID=UPI003D16A49B
MAAAPQWIVREDAGVSVLISLALRQKLGIGELADLPPLRGCPVTEIDEEPDAALAAQWLTYWNMTIEPRAHVSHGPLELVDGFDTLVALPVEGAEELRAAIEPHAEEVVAFAQHHHSVYASAVGAGASSYRAYASAIAGFERNTARRALSFELNVQVLPLTQRGIWWVGALTVAVTDSLRRDVAAFDDAIRPIIAELA